jgi:hypothetical protein
MRHKLLLGNYEKTLEKCIDSLEWSINTFGSDQYWKVEKSSSSINTYHQSLERRIESMWDSIESTIDTKCHDFMARMTILIPNDIKLTCVCFPKLASDNYDRYEQRYNLPMAQIVENMFDDYLTLIREFNDQSNEDFLTELINDYIFDAWGESFKIGDEVYFLREDEDKYAVNCGIVTKLPKIMYYQGIPSLGSYEISYDKLDDINWTTDNHIGVDEIIKWLSNTKRLGVHLSIENEMEHRYNNTQRRDSLCKNYREGQSAFVTHHDGIYITFEAHDELRF